MCGILGKFQPNGAALDNFLARKALELLARRGPDGEGQWEGPGYFFGHRRLSIIDLASGAQPMLSEDGRLAITFNGEIYNFLELREELRKAGYFFRTTSDTEVLLHGYRAWGEGLPARLTGMFAFAIADIDRHELFLARDRFGEKPLFLAWWNQTLHFASDLRTLLAMAPGRPGLNRTALAEYLCLNYVSGTLTLAEGVERLTPGNWRRYGKDGMLAEEKFWDARQGRTAPASLAEALPTFRELFDRAVALTLRADVPVGIFLSGGIDSSLVAESAARQGLLQGAYCLDFEDARFSEIGKANAVAKRLGITLHPVKLGPSVLRDFFEIAEFSSDPLADSSALPVWALARETARHCKVVVGGDGGDELFGGYLTYRATLAHEGIARLPAILRGAAARVAPLLPTNEGKVTLSYKLQRFLRAANLPSSQAHFTWNGSWLPTEAISLSRDERLRQELSDMLERLARAHGLGEVPSLHDLQLADLQSYLPNDILTKVDRMSMAHGLEVRAPFLNHHLAEFALSLPDVLKVSRAGEFMLILRRAAEAALGPEIANAPKQGFSVPIHHWVRGPGRDILEEILSPENVTRTGVLEPSAVEKAKRQHLSGVRSLGFELWGLMIFVNWYRRHLA